MSAAVLACILAANAPAFDSAQAAAIAGLRVAAELPKANSYEAAGVVFRCGDRFSYSEPRQNRERFSFEYRAMLPAGAALAAIFHTHPHHVGDASPVDFSEADVAQQRALSVPSYIFVVRYREFRVLDGGGRLGRVVKL